MIATRIFRNGNSQAVRIPAELAYPDEGVEVEIERVGDELRVRPVRRQLTHVLETFAQFGEGFMEGGRGDHEQSKRAEL